MAKYPSRIWQVILVILVFLLAGCSVETPTPAPTPTSIPQPELSVDSLITATSSGSVNVSARITNGITSHFVVYVNGNAVYQSDGINLATAVTINEGQNIVKVTAEANGSLAFWEGSTFRDVKAPVLVSSEALIQGDTILVRGLVSDDGGGGLCCARVVGFTEQTSISPSGEFNITIPSKDLLMSASLTVEFYDGLGNKGVSSVPIFPDPNRWERRTQDGNLVSVVISPGFDPFDPDVVGWVTYLWGYNGDYWQQYISNVPQDPQQEIPEWVLLKYGILGIVVFFILGVLIVPPLLSQANTQRAIVNAINTISLAVQNTAPKALPPGQNASSDTVTTALSLYGEIYPKEAAHLQRFMTNSGPLVKSRMNKPGRNTSDRRS